MMRRKSCFCFLQEFPYYSPQQRAERQKDASGKPASNSVEMMHTLLDLPPAGCAVVTDALFLKWQQPERMRTVAGQRIRVGDRHKAVRSDASCRCDCRRSWGCVHLRENRKRISVVACGLWLDTNAFFAAAVTLASPVGGTLFSTYIGARTAIIGSIMRCG